LDATTAYHADKGLDAVDDGEGDALVGAGEAAKEQGQTRLQHVVAVVLRLPLRRRQRRNLDRLPPRAAARATATAATSGAGARASGRSGRGIHAGAAADRTAVRRAGGALGPTSACPATAGAGAGPATGVAARLFGCTQLGPRRGKHYDDVIAQLGALDGETFRVGRVERLAGKRSQHGRQLQRPHQLHLGRRTHTFEHDLHTPPTRTGRGAQSNGRRRRNTRGAHTHLVDAGTGGFAQLRIVQKGVQHAHVPLTGQQAHIGPLWSPVCVCAC
jgi:hypothetical protein